MHAEIAERAETTHPKDLCELGALRAGTSWADDYPTANTNLAGVLAQASSAIAGIVRDSSDAVLPGVTIEAASPALIELMRTATSDDQDRTYSEKAATIRWS